MKWVGLIFTVVMLLVVLAVAAYASDGDGGPSLLSKAAVFGISTAVSLVTGAAQKHGTRRDSNVLPNDMIAANNTAAMGGGAAIAGVDPFTAMLGALAASYLQQGWKRIRKR